jgi:NitT/TauT family transport system substrate-binding protein
MKRHTVLTLAAGTLAAGAVRTPALADDAVALAIGQQGAWTSMTAQQGVDAGLFKRAGLELKLAYTAGGPDTIQSVTGGAADVGIGVGTTAVIAAFAKGAPIKIVSADFTGSGDLFYYVRPESAINSFADVEGHTVGFTRPGSSSYTIAQMLAAQAKVKPNFVATGDMPSTLTQVMSGQVDVGFSVAPLNLDLVQQKKIRIVARGGDVKALQNQTVRVDIANTTFLRDRREVAQRFFRTYAAAQDWVYGNLDKALANFARYNGIPIELAKLVVPYYPRRSVALFPVSDFDLSVKDAVELKFIPAPITPDQTKAIFDILAPHK